MTMSENQFQQAREKAGELQTHFDDMEAEIIRLRSQNAAQAADLAAKDREIETLRDEKDRANRMHRNEMEQKDQQLIRALEDRDHSDAIVAQIGSFVRAAAEPLVEGLKRMQPRQSLPQIPHIELSGDQPRIQPPRIVARAQA